MISVFFAALALQPMAGPPEPATRPATTAAAAAAAADESAILATIDAIFATLETGDSATFLKHVDPAGRITAVGTWPDGTTGPKQRSLAEYAARMQPGNGFVERIAAPVIFIDADIAMVWARFTLHKDGKLLGCGIDHFDMVRTGGTWKLTNLTYSTRTTAC